MNEENFDNNGGEDFEQSQPPKPAGIEKLYPLDWRTTDVKLAKGRFVHTLERPTNELILERDAELETEIPIAKDGSYSLPDETASEEIDAKYYERLVKNTTGYEEREIPALHKAKAFQGLFQREIYVDESADIFDEEITVIEEIGGDDEPDFVIRHVLRQPDEKDLKRIRQTLNNGKLMPDKRGRQKFVSKSNLRKMLSFYAQYFVRLDGAKIDERAFSDDRRDEFIEVVSPLVRRKVVALLVGELSGKLSD